MKLVLLIICSVLTFSLAVLASEPTIWSINSKKDVLKGEAKGVSISDDGSIGLAPDIEEIADTGQPYIWASVVDASGTHFLGTGSDGKIFKVDAQGKMTLFADLDELNVSALAIGKNGELFAGTSPDGKVYLIDRSGRTSVYFEPSEKYIWSLAVFPDGSLAVGTGENGKLYKVNAPKARPADSVLFDSSETHIISLAADKTGNLYAGTDSEGLVLRISNDGKAFGLLDSPLREIHELVIGVDGSVYVLALGESASASEPVAGSVAAANVTVSAKKQNNQIQAPPAPEKSRYDLNGTKSAVYRILPGGQMDVIWNSPTISAFALYAHLTGNGVLVGTSDKGRIYSVRNDGRETLTLQTGEGQISSIGTHGNRLFATSSNQGKLFRFGGPPKKEASYESPVLDANGNASWGRIWWRSTGNVVLQTRSGNTEKPNETWSDWSVPAAGGAGEQVSSPSASFLQWRAVLRSSPVEARLFEVNISYLPTNIAPEVLSIEILPANIGLAPNPPVPVDPNIETSGMDPADFGIIIPPSIPRKLYQRGAKSITWNAEDRNEDTLVYSIYFKEVGETDFKLLKKDVPDTFFTVDGLAFADGRYVFKIVASDLPSNPPLRSLSGELVSEPFDIDNTAPTVTALGSPVVVGEKVTIRFEAEESSSYVKKAEYSINGASWRTVYADDGISDSRRERFTVELTLIAPGEYSVALRVYDAVGNTGSTRVLIRK